MGEIISLCAHVSWNKYLCLDHRNLLKQNNASTIEAPPSKGICKTLTHGKDLESTEASNYVG